MELFQLRPPARVVAPLDLAVGKQGRRVGLGVIPLVAIFIGIILWALVLRFLLGL